MVNTRGYLTEYGKDLMTVAKKSGANIAIITDYDLTGINIASHSPKDMPWIDVDDTTLEFFNLNDMLHLILSGHKDHLLLFLQRPL
jgi:hypothetical protein